MRQLKTLLILGVIVGGARAQDSFKSAAEVNKRMVKVYGSGGFRGLPAYGTGILISPKGMILTSANHLLDTQDLRVHLADGTRYHAKVVVTEPVLDAAIIRLDIPNKEEAERLELPYFDVF